MYRLLAYILVGGLTGWLTTESQPSFLRCVSFFIYVFAIAQTIKKNFTLKFLFFFWFAFFLGQNFWLIHLINPINHPLLSVGAPLWIIMSGLLAIPFILLKKLYPINREPTELLSSLSCLTLFELFRNFFLSGFPFYSTISLLSWLKFYPAILGFTGIFIGSLLVLCATIFPIIFWKKLVSYLPAAFLACIVYPQTFFDHNKVAKIAVLQSHDDPYDESFFTRFSFCKDQVRSFKNIDCVIFPEGFWSIQYFDSFPLDLELHEKQKLESYARQMLELSKELDVDILLPFTHVDSEQNLFQSLGLIHKGELVGRYDKMHLMTLMESKWPILKDEWCDAIGVCNFVSGKEKTVLKGKYRYGPYICFDDYFEDDLYYE